MDDVWTHIRYFNKEPKPTIEPDEDPWFFQDDQDEETFEDSLSAQMGARDALLDHLQTKLEFPALYVVRCLNTDEKKWVFALCSNLESGQGTTPDQDVLKRFSAMLLRPDTPAEKEKWTAKWYWDHDLCGYGYVGKLFNTVLANNVSRYTAPSNANNIWPAEEIPGWRTGWNLEDMPDPAEHEALRYYNDPTLDLTDS